MQFLQPALEAWQLARQDVRFAEHRWRNVAYRISKEDANELLERRAEVQAAQAMEAHRFKVAMDEFSRVARCLDHHNWM